MSSDKELLQRELAELIEFCEWNSWEIIISGDSNAHYSLWGSKDTSKRMFIAI